MEYFQISQRREIVKPIKVIGLDRDYYKANIKREDFKKIPSLLVAYFENEEDLEIPDILTSPSFFISDRLKRLIDLYAGEYVDFKGIHVYESDFSNIEHIASYAYWVMGMEECNCLHPDTETFPTGMLKHMVLDANKINGRDILKVGGIVENRYIVSLPLAESIMRRNMYGVLLEKVEIKEEF